MIQVGKMLMEIGSLAATVTARTQALDKSVSVIGYLILLESMLQLQRPVRSWWQFCKS